MAAPTMDQVLEEVRRSTTLTDGVIVLLKAARTDPAKMEEAIRLLDTKSDEVDAILLENTPQDPASPQPT